jgi:RNA polymerase-interacting CarD/CdnL/TRCF family regulator
MGNRDNDKVVAPGEGVSIIGGPETGSIGGEQTEFLRIEKADGTSGWLPEEHIQPCPSSEAP